MSTGLSLPMSAWPTHRRWMAIAAASVGAAALAAAALYLSGALFLVLNKADPRQAGFASIVDYWHFYADDALLRKKLVAAIAVAGVTMLVVLPGLLVNAARPRRALHGDARFATAAEIARAGLLGDRAKAAQPRILIGRYRGHLLSLPGQL